MIPALIGFELRRRLKLLSTYVYALVLFASGFFLMLAAGGMFESLSVTSGNERVLANSPHTLFGTTSTIALLGLFTVAAVFGQSVYQDFGHNTWMIIFTTRVERSSYLIGRFLGAFVFSAVLFLAIGAGQLFASAIVYLFHPTQVGPTRLWAYAWPYLVQVWPMLFFAGALFYSLAALTRRMAPVYVGVVVLVLGYLLGTTLLQDVQDQTRAALLDPFGFLSFEVVVRYWTPDERNRDLAPLWGILGANRALWTGVGIALLGASLRWFRPTVEEQRGRAAANHETSNDSSPYPTVEPAPTTSGWVRASASFAWMFFREVTRSPVYWAFVLCGLVFVILVVALSKALFGTPTLPVTYQALEMAQGSFGLFMLITITFYAGELVFRDRDVGIQDIVDATRVPTWVGFLARVGALFLVALSFEVIVGLAALVAQVSQGFFDIEWRLYLMELLVLDFLQTGLICVLALFVQTLLNHKYLGHFAMVGYYVLVPVLRYLGVEDRLLRYGSDPGASYSDMNGYGHFLWPLLWYRLYWWGFATLLILVAYLLTPRGRETSWRTRIALARPRFTPAWTVFALVGVATWLGAGAFCVYNTRVLNPFSTPKDGERRAADYEKKYKIYGQEPQPRIIGADVRFDIHPSQRRLVAGGTYRLKNKTTAPVTLVFVNLPEDARIHRLEVEGAPQRMSHDGVPGVHLFTLTSPLPPGGECDLTFKLEFAPRGFRHEGDRIDVVENGTFFNNLNLPMLGYLEAAELSQDSDRRRYGFEPKRVMAPRDDLAQRQNNYIRQDSDFITYRATVSTEPGQIAVAPGTLVKEWVEDGRPHWQFAMDHPILNFFSVLSARYAVKRDEWNGVKLEIYHHPTHTWNLDRMMTGMKDALAYCSENFGPYQHRQARILEFPRYQSFAQAFPNTIPYSEAVGFIAQVRDDHPDDIDYPYYVTAHEIAHQWWAHQVVGANVRGATMTSESMAQYAALMVMKKKFGDARMRRYLKFELDRYLVGRATERKQELPLAHNENQMYIHYQKGTLAMYALQDFIGEERVNRALKKYVAAVRFQGPPYTTSEELIAHLREETPEEFRYVLEDLFETITLYDNRTESASIRKNGNGGYDVTIRVNARKFRYDDQGIQKEVEFDDWMDVGALDEEGSALHVEKRKVRSGRSELSFHVAARPSRVGIDPLNKLVDRNSQDNVTPPAAE